MSDPDATRSLPRGVTDHGRAANGLRVRSMMHHPWGGRQYHLVDLKANRQLEGGYLSAEAARKAAHEAKA